MKNILGLDIGTTSIGWAFVNEAESDKEKSSIIKLGVRVIPLSSDEKCFFIGHTDLQMVEIIFLESSTVKDYNGEKVTFHRLISW